MADQPSPLRQSMNQFWAYVPKVLEDATNPEDSATFDSEELEEEILAKDGVSRRQAAYYEKHISQSMILQHVRYSEGLLDNIEDFADKALQDLEKEEGVDKIHLDPMYPKNCLRVATGKNTHTEMMSEDHVRIFLTSTLHLLFSPLLLPFAFQLISHGKHSWDRIVAFRSGVPFKHVVADCVLYLNISDVSEETPLAPEDRKVLERLGRGRTKVVATWVVKKLGFASALVEMAQASRTGETRFPWQACSGEDSEEDGERTVSERQDAFPGPDSSINASELVKAVARNGTTTVSLEDQVRTLTSIQGELPNPPKGGVNLILQQAWAHAVEHNTSVVVISAGNCELVGIRCRKTQTLYLSNLVVPSRYENYGKLQFGIFLAAVKDSVERFKADALKDEDSVTDDEARRLNGGLPMEGVAITHLSDRIAPLASGIGEVKLRFRYGVYDSPRPDVFTPIPTPPYMAPHASHATQHSTATQAYLTLGEDIGRGTTGVVHSGNLVINIPGEGMHQVRVVAKLGFSSEQKAGLQDEYRIYGRLAEKNVQGVPTAFGLYASGEPQGPLMLLLTYEGKPIGRTTTDLQKAAFRSILNSLHDAGVVHDDIREPNLLINEDGVPFIIDFDRAVLDTSEELRREDREALEDIMSCGEDA